MNEVSLTNFLAQFSYSNAEISETFNEVKICLNGVNSNTPNRTSFESALRFLNSRDLLQVSVIIDDGDPIDYYSGNDVNTFLNDIDNRYSIIDDEEIRIDLIITKNFSKGIISIYDYQKFVSFLKDLSTQALLNEFYTHIHQGGNFLICELQTKNPVTKTNSIWFVNKNYVSVPDQVNRTPVINNAKTSCHYNLLVKNNLVADDFLIQNTECKEIEYLFNRISIILAIAFLFDITQIQNNTIEYRLNGYKSISGTIDLSLIKPDPEQQYFRIFTWVYGSGNFVDKLGLARNIISLHLENASLPELKGDPYRSIQSSYKIYEKQNIKQYIEIRNKISDQLLGFHDRANKVIENFASGFQKSAFALITFYISAVILKILNSDKLIEVFTIDTALLSTSFICCSVIYFFIQNWEVNAQKKRFVSNYEDVKKRYNDLLDDQDIKRIMNNDHEFNRDISFINDKKKAYTVMWFAFLAIFLITTWLLYFIYNPELVFRIQNWFEARAAK